MFTDEQIATKLQTVSASEAPAVVDKHSWLSALDVWALKVGAAGYNDRDETSEHQQLGLELEGGIVRMVGWAEEKPVMLNTPEDQETYRSRTHDLVSATPDGFIVNEEKKPMSLSVIEAKYVNSPKRSRLYLDPADHPDGIPAEVLIQVHWQMAAVGLKEAYVGALIFGRFRRYRIPWNQRLFDAVMRRVEEFWERYVIPQEPPPATAESGKALARLYPTHKGEDLLAGTDAIAVYANLLNLHEKSLESLDEKKAHYENRLKEYIQEAPGVEGEWGRATWKKSKDSTGWDGKKLAALLKEVLDAAPEDWQPEWDEWRARFEQCKKTKKGGRPFTFTFKEPEVEDGSQ